MKLICIAAVSIDGIIGIGDKIPWHIPEDFKHFRNTTIGNVLIVGRNTYLGLPKKALEGREYIVLNGGEYIENLAPNHYQFSNLDTIHSQLGNENTILEKVYVAGGSSIYDQLIDSCDVAIITWVNKIYPDGDKRFPIDKLFANFDAVEEQDWQRSVTGLLYKVTRYEKITL
jgi:dihydrofolate reductase